MKEEKEKKKRSRDFKMLILKRILAAVIVIFMLGAALYTPIYLLLNK